MGDSRLFSLCGSSFRTVSYTHLDVYKRQHPNRSITLTIDNTKTLLKSIDQGKLDVAFVEGYYAKDAYDAICYRKEPFLAVCAPSFPHWQSLTTLEDLLTCPLLLREEGSGSRAILERYLACLLYTSRCV